MQFVLPDGSTRRLGNKEVDERAGNLMTAAPVYGTFPDSPIIDRSEWPDLVKKYEEGPDDPFLPYVHDQDGVGQCNADATAGLAESIRKIQGLLDIQLSAADLYDRINNGVDQGSTLPDAMKEVTARGIGPSPPTPLLWHRGMRTATTKDRMRFRILEVFLCPTFDHFFSAILSGFRGVSGIRWFDNYNPDKEGWLPKPRGNFGGHAILAYKPAMSNGKYGIWHQNSWTTRYGIGGRMIVPETAYASNVGGLWVGRAMVDEGGVVPIPA